MISTISLRMLNSWVANDRRRLGQRLIAERADRLLDQVMEQLLDERGMRLLAGGQETGEGSDSVKLDHLAGAGLVRAGRVDRPPFLFGLGIGRRRRNSPA